MNGARLGELATAGLPRLTSALSWRWQFRVLPKIRRLLGIKDVHWCRVVMNRACEAFVRSLPFQSFDVFQISGATSDRWQTFGFRSYRSTSYPEYDVCVAPLQADAADLVIAEQVLEHVRHPRLAVCNIYAMLKPGGWFLVSTPFMIRLHPCPDDFSRWTEQGLKQLLIDGGFHDEDIVTGSWGNRACVRANFKSFPSWIPWWHSLRNEPMFPVVVWAFARRTAYNGPSS